MLHADLLALDPQDPVWFWYIYSCYLASTHPFYNLHTMFGRDEAREGMEAEVMAESDFILPSVAYLRVRMAWNESGEWVG